MHACYKRVQAIKNFNDRIVFPTINWSSKKAGRAQKLGLWTVDVVHFFSNSSLRKTTFMGKLVWKCVSHWPIKLCLKDSMLKCLTKFYISFLYKGSRSIGDRGKGKC